VNVVKRAKLHQAAKKASWMSNIPEFQVMDYNGSLMRWLNFFNMDVPPKDKKSWVINYWAAQDKPTKGLDKLGDAWFSQSAVLVKLIEAGHDLEERHAAYLDEKYKELIAKTKQPIFDEDGNEVVEEKPQPKGPSIQERIDRQARMHSAEFDAAIDDFCFKGTDFDANLYLKKHDISSPVAKKIADNLKRELKELEEAAKGSDPQLVEAYSNFSKAGLKKLIAFVRSCIIECNNMAVVARTTRKPRMRKEKPASVVAAKLQYLKEYPELKMRSIPAEKIVGATTVVLFDTKYRKLIHYECVEGATITIKGTTLQNFDPNKSYSKTIRKPEVMDGIQAMTKRPYNALIKGVRAVEAKVNGRINNNQIILMVFV
jgi:rubrerythrin